jgi:hypothetical protein
VLTPQQFNACKILIEYGEPKLGRIGAMPDAETFAVQLEKAIERNGLNGVIDITPTKEPYAREKSNHCFKLGGRCLFLA